MKTAKEMYNHALSVKNKLSDISRKKALEEIEDKIEPEILRVANAGEFKCKVKILNPDCIIELEKLGYLIKQIDGVIYQVLFDGIIQKDSDYHWSDKSGIPADDLLSK